MPSPPFDKGTELSDDDERRDAFVAGRDFTDLLLEPLNRAGMDANLRPFLAH